MKEKLKKHKKKLIFSGIVLILVILVSCERSLAEAVENSNIDLTPINEDVANALEDYEDAMKL